MPMKIEVCKDCHTQNYDEDCIWCWECDKEMHGSNDLRPITVYTQAELDEAVKAGKKIAYYNVIGMLESGSWDDSLRECIEEAIRIMEDV